MNKTLKIILICVIGLLVLNAVLTPIVLYHTAQQMPTLYTLDDIDESLEKTLRKGDKLILYADDPRTEVLEDTIYIWDGKGFFVRSEE